jgi:hypothetical protein
VKANQVQAIIQPLCDLWGIKAGAVCSLTIHATGYVVQYKPADTRETITVEGEWDW